MIGVRSRDAAPYPPLGAKGGTGFAQWTFDELTTPLSIRRRNSPQRCDMTCIASHSASDSVPIRTLNSLYSPLRWVYAVAERGGAAHAAGPDRQARRGECEFVGSSRSSQGLAACRGSCVDGRCPSRRYRCGPFLRRVARRRYRSSRRAASVVKASLFSEPTWAISRAPRMSSMAETVIPWGMAPAPVAHAQQVQRGARRSNVTPATAQTETSLLPSAG